jgi:2-aminoadipate transaminase
LTDYEQFFSRAAHTMQESAICAAGARSARRRELGDLVSWPEPKGGFFRWATFDRRGNADALLERAIAHRVVSVAGSALFVDGRRPSDARLSFSAPSPARIE